MKAVLEPKEILIRVMPSSEVSSGYYYVIQTKEFFRVYDDPPKMFEKIEKILAVYHKK